MRPVSTSPSRGATGGHEWPHISPCASLINAGSPRRKGAVGTVKMKRQQRPEPQGLAALLGYLVLGVFSVLPALLALRIKMHSNALFRGDRSFLP